MTRKERGRINLLSRISSTLQSSKSRNNHCKARKKRLATAKSCVARKGTDEKKSSKHNDDSSKNVMGLGGMSDKLT